MKPGRLNLITDVAGVAVGNAGDEAAKTGVTVVVLDAPRIGAVHLAGGAPATRETDLLAPEQTVEHVDAVVLSGGSAFGLEAAGAVMAGLAAAGRGYAVGEARVPLVPAAALFDLINGGDKAWGIEPPYRRLGAEALAAAAGDFVIGSVGAGVGATTANLKGGLGSASAILANGVTVGALVAVNALGQATIGGTQHFWTAPFEIGAEFGGLGLPSPLPGDATDLRHKGSARSRESTTLAVVATDATLTKAGARRLAVMAHDGFARALWPAHTPFDGDIVFVLTTGRVALDDPQRALIEIGSAAAATVSRAIARAVFSATPAAGDLVPTWRQQFGG
jgi:L-aminopeptidase/D-esterase-like protein